MVIQRPNEIYVKWIEYGIVNEIWRWPRTGDDGANGATTVIANNKPKMPQHDANTATMGDRTKSCTNYSNEWPTDIYGNRWYNGIPVKRQKSARAYKDRCCALPPLASWKWTGRQRWCVCHLFYWIDRMFSTRSASDVFFHSFAFAFAASASATVLCSFRHCPNWLTRARCALTAIYSRIQYHYHRRRRRRYPFFLFFFSFFLSAAHNAKRNFYCEFVCALRHDDHDDGVMKKVRRVVE